MALAAEGEEEPPDELEKWGAEPEPEPELEPEPGVSEADTEEDPGEAGEAAEGAPG